MRAYRWPSDVKCRTRMQQTNSSMRYDLIMLHVISNEREGKVDCHAKY